MRVARPSLVPLRRPRHRRNILVVVDVELALPARARQAQVRLTAVIREGEPPAARRVREIPKRLAGDSGHIALPRGGAWRQLVEQPVEGRDAELAGTLERELRTGAIDLPVAGLHGALDIDLPSHLEGRSADRGRDRGEV